MQLLSMREKFDCFFFFFSIYFFYGMKILIFFFLLFLWGLGFVFLSGNWGSLGIIEVQKNARRNLRMFTNITKELKKLEVGNQIAKLISSLNN